MKLKSSRPPNHCHLYCMSAARLVLTGPGADLVGRLSTVEQRSPGTARVGFGPLCFSGPPGSQSHPWPRCLSLWQEGVSPPHQWTFTLRWCHDGWVQTSITISVYNVNFKFSVCFLLCVVLLLNLCYYYYYYYSAKARVFKSGLWTLQHSLFPSSRALKPRFEYYCPKECYWEFSYNNIFFPPISYPPDEGTKNGLSSCKNIAL